MAKRAKTRLEECVDVIDRVGHIFHAVCVCARTRDVDDRTGMEDTEVKFGKCWKAMTKNVKNPCVMLELVCRGQSSTRREFGNGDWIFEEIESIGKILYEIQDEFDDIKTIARHLFDARWFLNA